MGPDGGEAFDGIPYWYYFLYPFLCCIRLAQPCVSFIKFIFQFLFGFQVDSNYWIYWKLVSFILEIIFELSCWFRWLIWIASLHFGYYLARILVLPLVIFYSIFGYAKFYNKKGHEPSSRRSKRIFFNKMAAYDRRLMLLSAYMLYEHMAPFFSLRCLRNSYFLFPFEVHLLNQHMLPSLCG